jgi:hypothetical protein
MQDALIVGLVVAGGFGLYFLPIIVAYSKGANLGGSVLVLLNLFFGWSIIGWIVALSIALGLPNRQQRAEIAAAAEARHQEQAHRRSAGQPVGAQKAGLLAARTTRRFATGFIRGLRSEKASVADGGPASPEGLNPSADRP